MRRFRHASRLVLTVATIGITQLLAVGALLMPRLWGQRPTSQRIPAPFDATVTIGTFVLGANDLLALVVAPLAMAAVAFFLDRTRARHRDPSDRRTIRPRRHARHPGLLGWRR